MEQKGQKKNRPQIAVRAKKEPTPICPKEKNMETNKVKISKKIRVIVVIAFIAIYILATYISLRCC